MTDSEICICAAIQLPDGTLIRGQRHDSCFLTLRNRPDVPEGPFTQGFVTSRNRFVDRFEAMDLMKAVDWISHDTNALVRGDVLFSEDLY